MSALCGLGVVGVIVGVGMRAEPNFKLEEECFSMRFDTYQKHWQEIAESAEHVRCWWFPQIGRVKISRLNRTRKVSSRFPSSPMRSETHYFYLVSVRLSPLSRTLSRLGSSSPSSPTISTLLPSSSPELSPRSFLTTLTSCGTSFINPVLFVSPSCSVESNGLNLGYKSSRRK